MVNQSQTKIKEYIEIVEKVAKVEHRRIPSHMVDYEELVSIGIIAVQALIKNKTPEQLEKYNSSYIGTAVRWAIRNELRNRYKWYSLKHTKDASEDAENSSGDGDIDISPGKVREAVYETILSIDSIAAASSGNDSPFGFFKNPPALPAEKAEIGEPRKAIRETIATFPQKNQLGGG